MQTIRNHKPATQGFTLIESVIALALGGMILTAILSVFVSFFQAWKTRQTPYEAFIEHVQQCTRFLQQEVNRWDAMVDAKNLTTTSLATVRLSKENQYVLGGFRQAPIPFLHTVSHQPFFMALVCNPSGLFLWFETPEIAKKRLTEGIEATGKTHIQKLLLSAYAEKIEYGFFHLQKNQWEFASDLQTYARRFLQKEPLSVCPNGLRMTFRKDSWVETRFVWFSSFYEKERNKPVSFGESLRSSSGNTKSKQTTKNIPSFSPKNASKATPTPSGGRK